MKKFLKAQPLLPEEIVKLVCAIARDMAREDHERAALARKGPRKRVLTPRKS
ncbi:MAG: hypothetical protein G4V63_18480 [Candidatus Afipia apatlaquensis]|uniref:Uncharacterized protein n=1 Tax=Candidatus Afipia apatlaquensis TaxID=2712852 RepID=A0A7C9VGB5_9BRAD|nr:hypothetical protein [Candidatus Afipia apatlaquensis]